ncbi:MAG: DUF455 family protein [Bdellovibrio sp.]|nr:DUF455 family protein [Bdellovibrio sp.]
MWAFNEPDIFKKILRMRQSADDIFTLKERAATPMIPARDISLLTPKELPPKKGLSFKEGQARLLHDLASIELQAMELGLRTLVEFPDAPHAFREQLFEVTLSESVHLEMCLTEIEGLGFKWGDWPVHCALWSATSSKDSLIDRILIVHRFLEGSGLDAGETILNRLKSIDAPPVKRAAERIFNDEIGHVEFGSRWYRTMCDVEKIDPSLDFSERLTKLRWVLPKRVENIAVEIRKKAGFTDAEIEYLKDLRLSFLGRK